MHRLSIAAESVIYFADCTKICLHLKQSGWQSSPNKYTAATLAQILPTWESDRQNDLKALFSQNVTFTHTIIVRGFKPLCERSVLEYGMSLYFSFQI